MCALKYVAWSKLEALDVKFYRELQNYTRENELEFFSRYDDEGTWIETWILDAIELWGKSPSYAGLTFEEFMAKLKPG